MTFEDAIAKLAVLQKSGVAPSNLVTQGGKGIGIFHGFAIDSETLEIFAISEVHYSWRSEFIASPAIDLMTVGFAGEVNIMDEAPDLQPVRHKKGGIYTQVRDVRRGEEILVLYISDDTGIWWIRPKDMFEDGRFTPISIPR